ncbi:PREDICTED: adherens junction-associated protein 1-like [Galeopterus variegatus]|uniref:Adherens junction-associated protein 1-like n=1 Tax=Galeopterus variegatus TaxID=482537 RepID=A0ABM0RXW8_GALVR|nr:PREDICTED: adherens junction-associated protein 1-like [Galeopterus variegatus]
MDFCTQRSSGSLLRITSFNGKVVWVAREGQQEPRGPTGTCFLCSLRSAGLSCSRKGRQVGGEEIAWGASKNASAESCPRADEWFCVGSGSQPSSMSVRWPGCHLGSHAWILIAMFQLAMDFPACKSLGPGPEFRLLPRPPHRPPRLWSLKSGQQARVPVPVWSPRPPRAERLHGQMQALWARRAHRPRDQVAALGPKAGLARPPAAAKSSPSLAAASSPSSPLSSGATEQTLLRRGRRHLQGAGFSSFDFRGGRPTTETEFIAWGPTGDEEILETNTFPGAYGPTTVSILQTRKTTVAATTTTMATTATSMTLQTKGFTESLGPRTRIPVGVSTTEPSASPSNNGKDTKPPRILGETSGASYSLPDTEPHLLELQNLVSGGWLGSEMRAHLMVELRGPVESSKSLKVCCKGVKISKNREVNFLIPEVSFSSGESQFVMGAEAENLPVEENDGQNELGTKLVLAERAPAWPRWNPGLAAVGRQQQALGSAM